MTIYIMIIGPLGEYSGNTDIDFLFDRKPKINLKKKLKPFLISNTENNFMNKN